MRKIFDKIINKILLVLGIIGALSLQVFGFDDKTSSEPTMFGEWNSCSHYKAKQAKYYRENKLEIDKGDKYKENTNSYYLALINQTCSEKKKDIQ